jgi:hypothetical protein
MQFTRYLYIRDEAEYSLLISLLKSSEKERFAMKDEIFFWAYELYFSGWEKETFNLLFKIYDDFYKEIHPTLEKTLKKKYTEWENTHDPTLLGTILYNLMGKPYSSGEFLKKYIFHLYEPQNIVVQKRQKCVVTMLDAELETYRTSEVESGKAWTVLRNVCRYSTYRTGHKQSVFVFRRADALFRFREKWLYYAFANGTPIWKSRISEYSGFLNTAKKTVEFADEDKEEAFYDRYNYEPDEQSTEVAEKCVGQTTKHGELKWLQIRCVIDFSGNRIDYHDIIEGEDEEKYILPPPPPQIQYFA